jgi:hypothetical protein
MPKKKTRSSLDITDNTFLDFKKSKSISVASKISDIKTSTIGELYDVKQIHDKMHKTCINKLSKKIPSNLKSTKKVSKNLCECLFEKNKNLSISELENRVTKRLETPGSTCISILNKFMENKNINNFKSSNTSSNTSRNTTSNTKTNSSKKNSSKKNSSKKNSSKRKYKKQ